MKTREILKKVELPYLKGEPFQFRPGDTLRVFVKVVEGESERVQPFEGLVLRRQGLGISETFTIRKISFGIGVERTFPFHSPRIEKIELLKSGRVRRAKLFYLRKLSGKAARLAEKEAQETEPAAMAAPETKILPEIAHRAQPNKPPEPAISH